MGTTTRARASRNHRSGGARTRPVPLHSCRASARADAGPRGFRIPSKPARARNDAPTHRDVRRARPCVKHPRRHGRPCLPDCSDPSQPIDRPSSSFANDRIEHRQEARSIASSPRGVSRTSSLRQSRCERTRGRPSCEIRMGAVQSPRSPVQRSASCSLQRPPSQKTSRRIFAASSLERDHHRLLCS